MNTPLQNNSVYLCGTVVGEPTFSHEIYGEKFYDVVLSVKRLSGMEDVLPVSISEHLVDGRFHSGGVVAVSGQFRSYNKTVGDKSKLMLTVFVRDVTEPNDSINPNTLELTGYICKPPVYRKTPLGREIADLLLAVNRPYGKSDYIPCICWGRNARFAGNFEVGSRCAIWGRIQSREYMKKLSEDQLERRVAYEVSVSKLEMVEEEA